MFRTALANLRAHKARLVAVTLAVLLAVAFMSATLILNSSMKATLRASLGEDYQHASLVVSAPVYEAGDYAGFETALAAISELPGVSETYAPRAASIGFDAGDAVQQFGVLEPLAPETFRSTEVREGRLPTAVDEVMIDANSLEQFGLRVGDRVTLHWQAENGDAAVDADGAAAEGGEPALVDRTLDLTLSGVSEPSSNPGSVGLPALVMSATGFDRVAQEAGIDAWSSGDALAYVLADDGADVPALQARIGEEVEDIPTGSEAEVLTADEAVAAQVAAFSGGTDMLSSVMVTFVAIAVFVSILVVSNTFSVLVAQRARELALLRCIGADKRQIRLSVLLEAGMMGLIASALGVVAAIGLMAALVGFAAGGGLGSTVGVFEMSWVAVAAPILMGVALTLVAALGPAREATRVSPLAAMRPADAVPLATPAGKTRLGLGLIFFVSGIVLLVMGSVLKDPIAALAVALGGSCLSAVGVVMLGVFVIPLLTGVLGRLLFSTRVPGRLATANSVRNPRRTASTATALLIGVTLVSTIYTGAAVAQETLDRGLDRSYPVDISVTMSEVGDAGMAQLRSLEGVAEVVPVRTLELDGTAEQGFWSVWGVTAEDYAAVTRNEDREVSEGTALLDEYEIGADEIEVAGPGETLSLRPITGGAPSGTAIVAPQDFERLAGQAPLSNGALIRLDEGVPTSSINAIRTEITGMFPEAMVSGSALERAVYDEIIQMLLLIVTGLLAVAIVIAVIGVGNTLSLSVIERTRENALLRALGLTRPQLRWTLAAEALLLALVAAGIGATLGVAYGNLGGRAVLNSFGEVPVVVPWVVLGVILVAAVLACLIASVLPARRAARLSPIEGLATS